jgi:hypothetical protein
MKTCKNFTTSRPMTLNTYAAGSGLAAKAFAPASCFPSSLRRVTSHKFTKFVRRSGEAFSGAAPQGRGEQTLKLIRSAVFPESSWFADFLLMRGCQRLGQPIEKPTSPRPSGTGIFPYSRMPAFKAPAYFQSASPRREQPSSHLDWIS